MTPIEAEAMLIRHSAAVLQLDHLDLDGRIAMLAQVVNPSDAVRAASMQVAEEKGPSTLAITISRHKHLAYKGLTFKEVMEAVAA